MPIRLLNAEAVRTLLPVDRCVDLMRRAMTLVATEGGTIQPIRQAVWHPDKRGLMSMMPGYVADP